MRGWNRGKQNFDRVRRNFDKTKRNSGEAKRNSGEVDEELRKVVMGTRADLAQQANIQSQLAREQTDLRQLVVQTQVDMAQFTEWAGIVTQAVEELREGQARHERMIERFDQRQAEIEQRQAESDQRFEVLLEEIRFLIRQRQFPTQEEREDA